MISLINRLTPETPIFGGKTDADAFWPKFSVFTFWHVIHPHESAAVLSRICEMICLIENTNNDEAVSGCQRCHLSASNTIYKIPLYYRGCH